jgi:hypothetical protein
MAKVMPALDRLELTDLPTARGRLGLAFEDVKLLRAETDSAVARPLDQRHQAMREVLLSRSGQLLKAMDAVSVVLETDIRRLDPAAWDMVRAEAIAWEARAGGGDNALLLNEVLAGHRAITAAELASIRINDGRIKAAWGLVRSIAEQPDAPTQVKEAFERAQAAAFEGPSVARREALIEILTAGPDPTFTVEDLSRELVPPLAAVGAVAVATMEVTNPARRPPGFQSPARRRRERRHARRHDPARGCRIRADHPQGHRADQGHDRGHEPPRRFRLFHAHSRHRPRRREAAWRLPSRCSRTG